MSDLRPDSAGFVECDACRAKPGTPVLCAGCLHNRAELHRIRQSPGLTAEQRLDLERLEANAPLPSYRKAASAALALIDTLAAALAERDAEIERLRSENHEAHAMLTGQYEIGWCMTHPDNKPDTELGRAAMEKNSEIERLTRELNLLQVQYDAAMKSRARGGG